jgi:hypothetical protein
MVMMGVFISKKLKGVLMLEIVGHMCLYAMGFWGKCPHFLPHPIIVSLLIGCHYDTISIPQINY